jgi:hypothetical protein
VEPDLWSLTDPEQISIKVQAQNARTGEAISRPDVNFRTSRHQRTFDIVKSYMIVAIYSGGYHIVATLIHATTCVATRARMSGKSLGPTSSFMAAQNSRMWKGLGRIQIKPVGTIVSRRRPILTHYVSGQICWPQWQSFCLRWAVDALRQSKG